MNFDMKHELFPPEKLEIPYAASCMPPVLYAQGVDWTCALACVRSIASGLAVLPDDGVLVRKMGLSPGPVYSGTIKRSGILDMPGIGVRYGCDVQDVSIRDLWRFLDHGWRVMVNWMYSYDHWTVLTAYIPVEKDPDYHVLQHWDPYCGEIFQIRAAHFSVMWQSGGNEGHRHDFIAVRDAG